MFYICELQWCYGCDMQGQNTVELILEPYSSVHVMYLVIAFLFKFCDVVHLVIGQSVVDVFLVDWERPDSHPETTHAVRQ